MDLELSPEEELLDDSLRHLFADHAGPARAREHERAVDHEVLKLVEANGFLDVFAEGGPIAAVLVAERASEAVVAAPVVARALVAPLAGVPGQPPAVGLVHRPAGITRYAGHCDSYLVLDGDTATVAATADVDVEPMTSRSPYPMGRVHVRRADAVDGLTADSLRRAWQVGLTAEIGSIAHPAVEQAAAHVRDRVQFGRPIGSFQAVQHRLARSYAMAMATKWLGRQAAWHHDDEYVTASAATFACLTARSAYDDAHQVCGAIGVTAEFGLVACTTRLVTLHAELGGRHAHARRAAATRAAHAAAG
jgi:alkylation response protein AidB-like acyl-CoA dehydrogenase